MRKPHAPATVELLGNPAPSANRIVGQSPYIDLTNALGDGRLDPGESVATRLYSNNPLRRRFTFSYSI